MPPLGRNSLKATEAAQPVDTPNDGEVPPVEQPPATPEPPAEHPQPMDPGPQPPAPTYHDSLSGRPVDSTGHFTDGGEGGPIPEHRIVSDSWPTDRNGPGAQVGGDDD